MTPARDGRMGELVPCPNPWCKKSDPHWNLNGIWIEIRCSGCDMRGPGRDTEAEAIAAWNTRAPNPLIEQLVEALERIVELESGAGYDPMQALSEIETVASSALSAARGETGK